MQALNSCRPLVVIILDGWGISFVKEGNAIATAPTPNMDSFAQYFPCAAIAAAGIEVGLPWGEVGNSETGHRNIGAGQVQYQTLPQVDNAIANKSFFNNTVLLEAIDHANRNNSNLHLMGLVSPGGVHSHMNHLFALLELCAKKNRRDRVYIHMFTDGRDTQKQSALPYLKQTEDAIGRAGVGTIASVTGRFYSMDRNKNWERTQATYDMLTGGPRPAGAPSARQAIEQSYNQNIFDEMIAPSAVTRGGEPIGTIRDNDAVIFFNFRPDRARQLTQAFVQPDQVGFKVNNRLQNLYFATMAQFDTTIPAPAAFIEDRPPYPLARVISEAGLRQFHIAETEKYAHVTYYLNVGYEQPFPGEDHVMIPSSAAKDFAEEPHMQAEGITNRVLEEVSANKYDVFFINFANADMVGHTGNFEAAVEACAYVDYSIGRLAEAVLPMGGGLLITADHGNAEEMLNLQTGENENDHSSNPVPVHFVFSQLQRTTPKSAKEITDIFSSPVGVLSDIAPTVLEILRLPQPPSMTGVSLLGSLR